MALKRTLLSTSLCGLGAATLLAAGLMAGCGNTTTDTGSNLSSGTQTGSSVDQQILAAAQSNGVVPLDSPTPPTPPGGNLQATIQLGQNLFFDKILSGTQSDSCFSCHSVNAGDGMSIGVGQDAQGSGPNRMNGFQTGFINKGGVQAPFFLRNTLPLYNVGSSFWKIRQWDGRVAIGSQNIGQLQSNGTFISPAGSALPQGINDITGVLPLFPMVTNREMMGFPGDLKRGGSDVGLPYTGGTNEVATTSSDPTVGWAALMARLSWPTNAVGQSNPYPAQFQAAFGHAPVNNANGIADVANALSAFMTSSQGFQFPNSPFEQYLRGNTSALTDAQKQGALVFFTTGKCVQCHTGPLLTDQSYHNIGVPQIGPGNIAGLDSDGPNGEIATKSDFGRFGRTQIPTDKFLFRTSSLHNVALTAPYMHDGVFATLEGAIRHHMNPQASFQNYNTTQVIPQPLLDPLFGGGHNTSDPILTTNLDPIVAAGINLSDGDVANLVAFLNSLTDPAAANVNSRIVPSGQFSPSGLPITDVFGGHS